MTLPQDFCTMMQEQLGEEYDAFVHALNDDAVCSIRLNSRKPTTQFSEASQVEWCEQGRYLSERPLFTLDPLLHAGCYYVQEASSMFVSWLLRQYVQPYSPLVCLDLCAAPGGKSTLLLNDLPEGSLLYANEPIRQRANILKENIIKWGNKNVVVTNNYPDQYESLKGCFDLILCDAPCSGEGMFRKDNGSIEEWSMKNVMMCQQRQREIVEDVWGCLREGGLFIYSTCTYNHYEDEDNVKWIKENLGAEQLPLNDKPEWGIRNGHFYPHRVKGEGFFIAIMRKTGEGERRPIDRRKAEKTLKIMLDGIERGRVVDKRGTVEPTQSEAMMEGMENSKWQMADLSRDEALQYLRGEALQLTQEGLQKGYVLVTYEGFPLGFCKNIGTRANNLFPTEWRIKKKL